MVDICCKYQVNDTRLYVVKRGKGYPVFVIHGGPGLDHQYFGNYLDALCDEFELIFVDLRGNGQSDPVPADSHSIAKCAEDIHELAIVMGIKEYAIYGHSYGSFVALKNAIDYPGSASHIILSSGSPSSAFLADDAALFSAIIEAVQSTDPNVQPANDQNNATDIEMSAGKMKEDFIMILPCYFSNKSDPRILEFKQTANKINYTTESCIQFSEDLGGFDYCDELVGIEVPVLIMVGEGDQVIRPKDSIYIHEKIRTSDLVIFKNAGHFVFVEQQIAHNDEVRRFLKR